MWDGTRILASVLWLSSGAIGRALYLLAGAVLLFLFGGAHCALSAAAGRAWSVEAFLSMVATTPFGMMLGPQNAPEEFPLALVFATLMFRLTLKRIRDIEWDAPVAWLSLLPIANLVLWGVCLATPGWQNWDFRTGDGPLLRGHLSLIVPKSGIGAVALACSFAALIGWTFVHLGTALPGLAAAVVLLSFLLAAVAGPAVLGFHRSRPFLECFGLGFGLSIIVLGCVCTYGHGLPEDAIALSSAGLPIGLAGACLGYGLQLRPRRHVCLDPSRHPLPKFQIES